MQRIAVTGGNGQLGRHVVAALEPDYEVTVIDRTDGGTHQPHGAVDVLDLDRVSEALRGQDAVTHLAAIDAATDATPRQFFHTNTLAAWNVLQAGYEAGVRRFAMCSSSSAYGVRAEGFRAAPRYLPLDEDHPALATDPYGLSKRACETIGQGFAARPGVSVAVLRPCYVAFEPGVPRMRALHEGRDEPSIDGWRAPLPPLRWFVSPQDAAACFRLAIETDVGYDVFNVSAAETFGEQPTLMRVEALFGELPEIRDPERFAVQPYASPMDCSRARRVLGWTPEHTLASLTEQSG
jgi:nucleoside-diphosphate-sugar epimerase